MCLVFHRQAESCFTSSLNNLDTKNCCKASVIPKAPCMALAEFVLLWLGAGVEQGQVWAALLLWWAPCHTLRRAKLSRGTVNPNLCSMLHRDTLSAVVFQSSADIHGGLACIWSAGHGSSLCVPQVCKEGQVCGRLYAQVCWSPFKGERTRLKKILLVWVFYFFLSFSFFLKI